VSALPKGVSAEINQLLAMLDNYQDENHWLYESEEEGLLPMDPGDSAVLVLTRESAQDIQDRFSGERHCREELWEFLLKIKGSLLNIQIIYKTKEA